MKSFHCFILLLILSLSTGCTFPTEKISISIVPVSSQKKISKIYVRKNDKDFSKEFIVELISQLRELGFESESYTGEQNHYVKHYLTYDVRWNWDLAMYLYYFKATLYEDGKILGEIEYDATGLGRGRLNLDIHGRTKNKIRPLLKSLLEKVKKTKVELSGHHKK